MMSYIELAELCKPSEGCSTYYRPFVCRRYQKDNPFTIWIVGTNPATAIETSDIGLKEYAQMLTDHEAFNEFYSAHRRQLGLEEWSPTRKRIRQLGDEFPDYYNVIETNVNAFPTKDTEGLIDGSIDFHVVKKGWLIFKETLNKFRPDIIVAHGKETLKFLTQLAQFTPEMNMERLGIRDWETTGIRYADQRLSVVIPCTHFSRISHKEFEELTNRIESLFYIRPADRDFVYIKPMPKEH